MFILEMVYGQLVPATLQTALMALGCAAEKNGTTHMYMYNTYMHELELSH